MKRAPQRSRWPWLAALAAVGAATPAVAQSERQPIQDPKWATFHINQVSVGAYAEGNFENSSMKNSGVSAQYNRFFVGPTLGINCYGSIYHPNLLLYRLNVEGAYGWGREVSDSNGTVTRKEYNWFGMFQGSATLLGPKPYATTIFSDYDQTYQNYDFFNTVQVNSFRYGVTTGYSEGPVPVRLSYWHRDQNTIGYTDTQSVEDVVNLNLRNVRARGTTGLDFSHNNYTQTEADRSGFGGNNTVSLYDAETFGQRDQYHLNANVSYNPTQQTSVAGDQWIAGSSLNIDHSDILSSLYNFNYDRYTTGSYLSQNYVGNGALRHLLYDSLTSTLMAQGSYFDYSDLFGSSKVGRYGGGLGEGYKKNLGDGHQLTLDNTFLVEHSNVDNTGALMTVMDERHSFADNGAAPANSFFLNQPRVVGQIVITDDVHTQPPYLEGRDYSVIRNGLQTLIQWNPAGNIRRSQILLVSYHSMASPSGSYATLTEAFRFRVSLWEDLLSLYTRVSLSLNNAPADMLVQDLHDYAFGVETKWRFLRAGAEYEIYDSTLSSYRGFRLFQSFAWQLDEASTFGTDFTETWTDYLDANRQEQWYTFMTQYHRAMTYRLSFNIEGGVSLRRGPGVEQTLAVCRPGLEYNIGKTTVKAGYDYGYNQFLDSEIQNKNMFFLRIKRVF